MTLFVKAQGIEMNLPRPKIKHHQPNAVRFSPRGLDPDPGSIVGVHFLDQTSERHLYSEKRPVKISTKDAAMIQVTSYYLWLLGAFVTITVAQLSEYQPEEENYSAYNQVSSANDANNPWANYQQQVQQPLYSGFSNVDRQGILDNPEVSL
eukprot:TCALIF_13163-PA protein Name:"Protein of unknown function" AED:0.19 eAED:0.19 QI:0/0.5/0/0.66/0.5/0.33/3/0/150